MYVREWGAPDGRPLVFWHALGALTSGAPDQVPPAEIHSIEDAGHDLFADAGPRIAPLIRDWAARI